MNLLLRLTLHADHEFSFKDSLCIKAGATDLLCSEKAEINAIAMWRDDGSAYSDKKRRWNHIKPFFDPKQPYYNAISPQEGSEEIDKTAIYHFYGYQGIPKWDLMVVKVVYRFPCPGKCPQTVVVNANNLVSVDSVDVAPGNRDFHKVHVHHYEPTSLVQ